MLRGGPSDLLPVVVSRSFRCLIRHCYWTFPCTTGTKTLLLVHFFQVSRGPFCIHSNGGSVCCAPARVPLGFQTIAGEGRHPLDQTCLIWWFQDVWNTSAQKEKTTARARFTWKMLRKGRVMQYPSSTLWYDFPVISDYILTFNYDDLIIDNHII